jgi:hypothetical protein
MQCTEASSSSFPPTPLFRQSLQHERERSIRVGISAGDFAGGHSLATKETCVDVRASIRLFYSTVGRPAPTILVPMPLMTPPVVFVRQLPG